MTRMKARLRTPANSEGVNDKSSPTAVLCECMPQATASLFDIASVRYAALKMPLVKRFRCKFTPYGCTWSGKYRLLYANNASLIFTATPDGERSASFVARERSANFVRQQDGSFQYSSNTRLMTGAM